MSLSDPIGDMIARVKNAQARNHKKVELPSSNFKTKIADILTVSYTHLRAHETRGNLVCRLLLEKKKK